jgi:hypothetical protein
MPLHRLMRGRNAWRGAALERALTNLRCSVYREPGLTMLKQAAPANYP